MENRLRDIEFKTGDAVSQVDGLRLNLAEERFRIDNIFLALKKLVTLGEVGYKMCAEVHSWYMKVTAPGHPQPHRPQVRPVVRTRTSAVTSQSESGGPSGGRAQEP
eukprot:TRINITY_DN21049_c0_g4_i1.p1 TRINITY_DN21049_c0_g4~~TRINITY_DN21049_c0_g4_i1.p1  ORF type:complete len:115 (-),score=5.27 TRINITY_DN21049_c0_g4_i1:690-1007(-)